MTHKRPRCVKNEHILRCSKIFSMFEKGNLSGFIVVFIWLFHTYALVAISFPKHRNWKRAGWDQICKCACRRHAGRFRMLNIIKKCEKPPLAEIDWGVVNQLEMMDCCYHYEPQNSKCLSSNIQFEKCSEKLLTMFVSWGLQIWVLKLLIFVVICLGFFHPNFL